MTLFEVDRGRLIPAQFGHTVTDGLSDELLEAVRAQVLEIISRPLFPITWNDLSRTRESSSPRLTALDATGQVVSVEVLRHLTSDNLISALSSLADTASLSWTDLAREYPGGIPAFRHDWLTFRDSMPPSPGAGPRLIMVVGSIDSSARSALEVLVASGVEVHELNLRQMNNGRSFLSVSPVGLRVYAHVPQIVGHDSDIRQIDAHRVDTHRVDTPLSGVSSAGPSIVDAPADGAFADSPSADAPVTAELIEDTLEDVASGDSEVEIEVDPHVVAPDEADPSLTEEQIQADVSPLQAGGDFDAEIYQGQGEARQGQSETYQGQSETYQGQAEPGTAPHHGHTAQDLDLSLDLELTLDSEEPEDSVEPAADAQTQPSGEQSPAQLSVDRRTAAPAYPRVTRSAPHARSSSDHADAGSDTERTPDAPEGATSPEASGTTEAIAAAASFEAVVSSEAPASRDTSAEVASSEQMGAPAHMDRPAREDIVQVIEHNSDGLRSIAVLLGEDVALVGAKDSPLDVPMTLTASGTIRVWYREFTDMTEALAYAGQRGFDGWNDLHLADALGPTLAEAIDEINIDIMREQQR